MKVVAARDIASGDEVLLTYTAPLLATPVRQVRKLAGKTKAVRLEAGKTSSFAELARAARHELD